MSSKQKKNTLAYICAVILLIVLICAVALKDRINGAAASKVTLQKSSISFNFTEEDIENKIEAHQREKLVDYDYRVKERNAEEKYLEGYNAFHVLKNNQLAISLEDEALKIDDKYYKAYNLKGIALCYSGKFDEGVKNINMALSLNPDYGYARFNKALAYELYGHFDTAIELYHEAMDIEYYPWSYYGISSIYGRRGDVQNTVKYLTIAIELDPDAKAAARIEKDFNNVKNSPEFQNLLK